MKSYYNTSTGMHCAEPRRAVIAARLRRATRLEPGIWRGRDSLTLAPLSKVTEFQHSTFNTQFFSTTSPIFSVYQLPLPQPRPVHLKPMSNRRVVTVLYCEKELQRTVFVPPSFTMAQAEAAAAKELVDHLRRLPGLSLDNKRIHIYFLARLLPGTNTEDPDASGESIQGQTSSQPSFQAGHPDPHPSGHISTMTAIYSGVTLTLSFPSSTTVADVKAVVLKEVLDQIRCYPKISPTIALDDTRVDICPGGSTPDTRMGDLCASGEFTTMVVWPKAAPGSTIMLSPLADVLADLNAEDYAWRS
ncbi:hypothetical protein BD779DRAFT_283821 [Infundibulicybe gibba]|nr:hypothetical protein BD779DRAFT_283821 [Infundibulicybe gibba]